MSEPKQEICDRAAIVVARMVGWVPEEKRGELAAHIRIALDTEVEAGGPYINNGWNKRSLFPPEPIEGNDDAVVSALDALTCDQQYALAQSIAANIGYVLVEEPPHPDSPHERTLPPVEFLRKVQTALYTRFPRCRDCADDGPTCPNSGLPCDLKAEFDAIYAALSLQDHGWQTDIENAPKDGREVLFPIEFTGRAYWDDELKRWVLSYPLHMDFVSNPSRYRLPKIQGAVDINESGAMVAEEETKP